MTNSDKAILKKTLKMSININELRLFLKNGIIRQR